VSVVYTHDGTVGRIYINCNLVQTRIGGNAGNSNIYDLFLGRLNSAQYPYWFNGDMDEVRIYDRALTQDEVTIYGGCAAAPVTLTNFAASVINKRSIRLNWETENESEMKEYAIQRSVSNENNFITIGKQVPANKPTKNSYTFTDNNALPNTLYQYRLEMVDLDGSKKYSAVKTAKIDNNELFITLVQNPAKNLVQFRTSNYSGDASLSLYNAAGMLVRQSQIRLINNQLSSFNTGSLAKGFYWMHIQASNRKIVEKIFLIN
ncbi:MAG: LamG-like jellyroll fold domain-containing protein, partial [Ferruginibacter sp.]